MPPFRYRSFLALVLGLCLLTPVAQSQDETSSRGSRNLTLHAHVPFTDGQSTDHLAIEQELNRPFLYVASGTSAGLSAYSIADPATPRRLMTWALEDAPPNTRSGDLALFKYEERHYVIQTLQSDASQQAPGAILLDVTNLGTTDTAVRVGSLHAEGGLHSLFPYKHSDGRTLLFATGGGDMLVYDLGAAINTAGATHPIAALPTPEQIIAGESGFEDMFVGYHIDMEQDRLYGAGAGGYYVYDVTDPNAPTQVTHVRDAAVTRGHGIQATPDGRHIVTTSGYRTAPIRIFDLQPAFEATVPQVRTAIGAWVADWRNHAVNIELRWPYLFVASLHDGLQIVNMRTPDAPYTTAYYRTWLGTPGKLADPSEAIRGAWDVDVRNADGLIVVSDRDTGLWILSLASFKGWHGHGWGLPHVSSVQDWDNGPDGTQ